MHLTICDNDLTYYDMQVHKEILLNLARNMQSFGRTEQEILSSAGISLREVVNEHDMVEGSYGIKLWKVILEETQYPLVGLSFGKNLNFSALSWISALTQSAKNLQEAWKSFCDFSLLMGDMYAYELKEEKERVSIIFKPHKEWLKESAITAQQASLHAMSMCMSLSAFLCGRTIALEECRLAFSVEQKYRENLTQVFKNVHVGCDENVLVFSQDTANIPVITSNESVYNYMLQFCEQKLKELNTALNYADKVKNILHQKNSFYLPKIDEVSAMLHLSARTLQRKLKEENVQYHQLVEEYQITQAKNLLKQKEIQVKEVAYLLGYANSESFNRAFKKNTGMSPKQYR